MSNNMGRATLTHEQKVSKLQSLVGEEEIARLLNYAFEYADYEANFLLLKQSCTPETYQNAYNQLCIMRQIDIVDRCYQQVMSLITAGKDFKFTINSRTIPRDIHRSYFPNKLEENLLEDGTQEDKTQE